MINYKKLFCYLFLIGVWTIVYYLVDNPIILPSILDVAKRIYSLFRRGEIYSPLFISLGRIFIAILGSIILGTILSYLSYLYGLMDFFSPIFSIVKSTPVVSMVLIILFFSNKSYLSGIIVFLITTPIIYENILNGLNSLDSKKLDFMRIYPLNALRLFRYIHLPIIIERILFSMVLAIGIAVKAAVTSEVIGGSSRGLGNLLYLSKISFEMVDLLSITIIIVVSSYIIEEFFRIIHEKWVEKDD
mgnify:CR=1 FL=1